VLGKILRINADGTIPADNPFFMSATIFFADLCVGWIRKLDPSAGNTVVAFAQGISLPLNLKVGANGSLYYLARGAGATTGGVFRIDYVAPTLLSLNPAVHFD